MMTDNARIAVIQSQLTDLRGDIAELSAKLSHHEEQHRADARDRRIGRRWLTGTTIAVLAVVETPIGFLLAHVR
jgi:hypothetical protein